MPRQKVTVQVIEGPTPLYPPESAAKMLGLPSAETIRAYCREGRVFQPGTEAIKTGSHWGIDVEAYRQRMAKEQKQTRFV